VAETDKLTPGQKLTVWVSHFILTLMEYKGNYWLTNFWMVRYQSMLCENPWIRLEVVKTLNLATLLLVDLGPLEHDCLEIIDKVFSSWPDLTNQPISHPDIEYFTDGSSFVQHSTHFTRYAVVTLDSLIEACPLPLGTSAQKAELVTLTQALQLTAGVWINIFTDSKYAFTTIHIHGVLYNNEERGLINWERKSIKYGQEILELLDVVGAPKQVAVIHCPDTKKEMQQLLRETGELTERPSKQPS
jgi:ribonuclease HI